ncbi:MAG: DUF4392 domain-containing protein [Firmicutes bacterium]|nr:DUF4392 domain-containing protein [Bacillota bacterium]
MKIACDNIDRLVNVAIRPKGMPRSQMSDLYDLVKGENPISYDVAKAVLDQPGAKVGIFTGAAVPGHLPKGENDGPLGSIVLGRALQKLGYDVNIYTELENMEGTVAEAKLIGCEVPIIELERGPGAQHSRLSKELDIAFAIEKAGVNDFGVQHSVNGNSRKGTRAVIDDLIDTMTNSGKLTVGLGDGGNEIGFGKVFEKASDILPYGRECQCGCGGGIVTVTATTYLYPISVSNWGAYALTSALAIGAERPDIILEPEEEGEMLRLAIDLDLRDGGTGTAVFAVDGISGEASMGFVELLKEIVIVALTPYERDF